MRILVAGATGYLGRHLVTDLLAAGHEIRALARAPHALASPAPAAPGIPPGACEVFAGDVTDPDSLLGAADAVDVVVSTVGVTGHGGDPWAVDHRGNLALLDEALRAGARRFVYAHVLHGEQIPADLTRAKTAFAEALRRSRTEHLVVSPSGFFSDLGAYLAMARSGVVPVVDGGRARVSPIHGADLGAFLRRGIESGATGERPVGGPETLTHRQVAELAFEVLHRRPRIVSVPSAVIRAAIAPMRVVAPTRAGVADFLLRGLVHDAVAPATGERTLREHFVAVVAGRAGS